MTNGGGVKPVAPKIVGWVEHKRNPTNADKCWVSFLKRHIAQLWKPEHASGSPTYLEFVFLAKST
ncbi:hypothetical protein F7734_21490 [Scytonema sp. UIC 10036]|uniref:hypothetical protein n=1 Tax=Scytonema sp. UIC 10036 TaxID=2304196 RepID=UPI0012DA381E|nr:hypothetical protein [Scytonema sp. UIC 10036]MUG94801.1 hypothetical protein [Scytonema sp. UIC 10036]